MTVVEYDAGKPQLPAAAAGEWTGRRIEQLDGLRGIAFLLVFLNHSIQLPMAWVGVDLFFVLSGFLITGILVDSRERPFSGYIGHFYRRRIQRILPPYLVVLALVLLIVPPPGWDRIWWQYFTFLQNTASALQLGVGVLNPYWSLAVEEQFYLFWPLICFFTNRRLLYAICIAVLVAAPMARALLTPQTELYTVIFCLTPFRADLLAAGALLALVWRDHREALRRYRLTILVLIPVAAVVFVGPALFLPSWRATANSVEFNTFGYSASVLLFTLVVAAALVAPLRLVLAPLLHPWLRYVGRVSYMSYLIHEPFLHFTLELGKWAGSAVGFVLTLLFATVSWYAMEKPILSRVKVGTRRRHTTKWKPE